MCQVAHNCNIFFQGGGEATRPGTEKLCSHNLQSDPLGSSFKKGRENFPLKLVQ